MIILGIDPGTTRIGYGVIKKDRGPVFVECGLLKISGASQEDRLMQAITHLKEVISKHRPDLLAIEKLFFVQNLTTGLKVAEMRGAILLLAKERDLPVKEYAPTEVKRIVAGFGNADKKAVLKMVKLSLNQKEIPGPDDVSDALAIGLAAAYSIKD